MQRMRWMLGECGKRVALLISDKLVIFSLSHSSISTSTNLYERHCRRFSTKSFSLSDNHFYFSLHYSRHCTGHQILRDLASWLVLLRQGAEFTRWGGVTHVLIGNFSRLCKETFTGKTETGAVFGSSAPCHHEQKCHIASKKVSTACITDVVFIHHDQQCHWRS